MAGDKFSVQSFFEDFNSYNGRLDIGLAEIAVFMFGKLDPPVLAYKDQALARKNRRRKIIA